MSEGEQHCYRDLTKEEREILEMLLEPNFPGSIELRVQLSSVKAKVIDEDGGLALQSVDGPEAPVRWRVPTEGECKDSDGGNVHILLHVLNGRMCELELYREDGSQVRRLPNARDLCFLDLKERKESSGKGKLLRL